MAKTSQAYLDFLRKKQTRRGNKGNLKSTVYSVSGNGKGNGKGKGNGLKPVMHTPAGATNGGQSTEDWGFDIRKGGKGGKPKYRKLKTKIASNKSKAKSSYTA